MSFTPFNVSFDSFKGPSRQETPSNQYPESNETLKGVNDTDYTVYEAYEGLYNEGPSEIVDVDEIQYYDDYFNAEVMLPQDGEHVRAVRVIGQLKDKNGNVIGSYDPNPILNTKIYDVLFPDGSVQQYAANTIAENIYAQIDEDGYRYQLMDGIVGHRTDGRAVKQSYGYVVSKNDKRTRRRTTKGWHFNVNWKDGATSWVPLRELKESHPIQVAEYVDAAGLKEEPAFAW